MKPARTSPGMRAALNDLSDALAALKKNDAAAAAQPAVRLFHPFPGIEPLTPPVDLPPMHLKAWSDLSDALSKPADPNFVWPWDRKAQPGSGQELALERTRSTLGADKIACPHPCPPQDEKTPKSEGRSDAVSARQEMAACAARLTRGATELAETLKLNRRTLSVFLSGSYKGHPRSILAAWSAFKASGTCPTCGQPPQVNT